MNNKTNLSRRSFLKHASVVPFLKYSPLLASSSAFANICNANNQKSLVCVFLLGGADSFNFVVPGGSKYNDYLATRGHLAVSSDQLLASTDRVQGSFGFNNLLPGLHDLYENDQLAIISNVGNLIKPTTQADFAASTALPQSLFAHDAQQKLWQTASGHLAESLGWGGSIAEQVANCNASSNISTSISIDGSNTWLTNLQESYVTLSPNASIARMKGHNPTSNIRQTLENLLADAKENAESPFKQEIAHGITRAKDTADNLADAINDHPVNEMSSSGKLGKQLHMVARMISTREQLNMGRQVFFVGLGGWDTHTNQNVRLVPLLTELNAALSSFQSAINSMGKADSVTTFTASDFGRTLTSNGDGTDHGWGGHALVMGGSVKGGQIYGSLPSFSSTNNPDDAGHNNNNFAGRIIPKLSVAQYAATLATWMGVTEPERDAMLPNLSNFAQKNLGFMQF
ncbi:MAG: DUF1501 domain-containing protein [Methylococcales bacterium]